MNKRVFALLRTMVVLVIEAACVGVLFTFILYPWLDAHRMSGAPPIPPFLYIITWLVLCALVTFLIVMNIRAYTHSEQNQTEV